MNDDQEQELERIGELVWTIYRMQVRAIRWVRDRGRDSWPFPIVVEIQVNDPPGCVRRVCYPTLYDLEEAAKAACPGKR